MTKGKVRCIYIQQKQTIIRLINQLYKEDTIPTGPNRKTQRYLNSIKTFPKQGPIKFLKLKFIKFPIIMVNTKNFVFVRQNIFQIRVVTPNWERGSRKGL